MKRKFKLTECINCIPYFIYPTNSNILNSSKNSQTLCHEMKVKVKLLEHFSIQKENVKEIVDGLE